MHEDKPDKTPLTHDPQKAEQSRRLLEQYRALPLSERKILAEKLLGQETDEQRKKDELWKQFKAQFRQEMREKYGKPSPEAVRQAPLLEELPARGSEDTVSKERSRSLDSSTDLGVLGDPVWLTQAVETTQTLLEAEPDNPRYQRQLASLKTLLDNAQKK